MADAQNSPVLVQIPTPPDGLRQRAEQQQDDAQSSEEVRPPQDGHTTPDADTLIPDASSSWPETEIADDSWGDNEPIQPATDRVPEMSGEATSSESSTDGPTTDSTSLPPDAPHTPELEPAPPPEWVTWEEDTSVPTEEEMKEFEGTDACLSALDVAAHEKKMFREWSDPDQRPVKKIRLSWVIKGVRGTKERPNMARTMHSPAALIDGIYWQIKFYPRGNKNDFLSAYIRCSLDKPAPDTELPESTFAYFEGPPDANVGEGAEPKEVVKTGPAAVGKEEKMDGIVQSPQTPDKTTEAESIVEPSLPTTSQGAQAEADTAMDSAAGAEKKGDTSTSAKKASDFRVSAQLGMVIYNPQEPRTATYTSSEHQFNQYNDDWGWTNFVGPWKDIHKRQRGQYQALLRNDTLAIDAYILIFDDPTQALWWHESSDHEPVWPSKELAGYYPMGTPPLYHSPAVAGLTCWLLLAPFRRILQTVHAGKWRQSSQIRPRPLVGVLQHELHTMRRLTRDNYVDLSKSLETLQEYGETYSDVISFWEVLRRSIELEISEDEEALAALKDIFDAMGKTVKVPTLPVQGVGDIQQALQKVTIPGPILEQGPKFLPLALKRESFDQATREWKLHHDRVTLNEEIEIPGSGEKYTLYGFVVHVGQRDSGKFYSILRPDGPGAKWLAFEDGDGNKVFSYTRHKLKEFEGLEGEALSKFKGTRSTAYLAMYIKTSCVPELLPGALEDYEAPSWILSALEANGPSDEKSKEAMIEIEVYHDDGLIGCTGLVDRFNMKTQVQSSPHFKKYTFPRATTFQAVRKTVADDLGLDNPQKLRLFLMKNTSMGHYTNPHVEALRLKRTIADKLTAVQPLCVWCSTLKTKEEVELFAHTEKIIYPHVAREDLSAAPTGEQVSSWDPVFAGSGQTSNRDTSATGSAEQRMETEPEVNEVSPDQGASAESSPPPAAALEPPNSSDVVMEDAPAERRETEIEIQRDVEHGDVIDATMSEDNNTSTEAPAPSSIPGLDAAETADSSASVGHTEGRGDEQDVSNSTPGQTADDATAIDQSQTAVDQQPSQAPSDPAILVPSTASTSQPPPAPAFRTCTVRKVYGFLQLFDADKQNFVVHSTFYAKLEEPVKEAVRRFLGYDKDKAFLVWHREVNLSGSAVDDKASFDEINFADGASIVVGEVLKQEVLAELRQQGKFSDPFRLSRYLLLRQRRHPIQSLTTSDPIEISVFGGEYFRGPLANGQPHGPNCTIITTSGHTYTGPMVMSQKSGEHGKMIYQNGDMYEGGWLDDERHGQGTWLQQRTGNKYVGGFLNGKRWGKGTTHWEMADEEASMCQICYGDEIDALFYDSERGQKLGEEIRTAVHGVTGLGEVIRGTVNSKLDGIFPDKETDESRAKNAAITTKGYAEVEAAEKLFAEHKHQHHHGLGQGSGHQVGGVWDDNSYHRQHHRQHSLKWW
ncbi:hypothetical protein DV738_g2366, partial [Chaetothyriales sp. CBS 135597]